MTATKGMIWKTPWRRRTGGLVNQPPVDMWFFDLSGGAEPAQDSWEYVSPAPLPSFASGPGPFWLGLVCRIGGVDPAAGNFQGILSQRDVGVGFRIELDAIRTSQLALGDTENGTYSLLVGNAGSLSGFFTGPPGPVLQYDWECVTVFFARVTPGVNTQAEGWLDNVYLGSSGSGPYVPANQPIRLSGGIYTANGPTVHGAVGGTGVVTDAQVAQWFSDVKAGAQIVGIPGQTTDLWSAAAVQPLAPNPLPNLAGGQVLNLTAIGTPIGPPSNVLVPVSFNY